MYAIIFPAGITRRNCWNYEIINKHLSLRSYLTNYNVGCYWCSILPNAWTSCSDNFTTRYHVVTMRYLMVRPWVFSWWPWATSWWDPWVFSWSPWATSWRDHEFSHGHHELAHGREVMWIFFVTMRYLMVSHQKIYLMVGKWCKKNWPPPHHEVGSWSRGETMSYLMVTTRYLMVSWLGSDVKFVCPPPTTR